MLGLEKLRDKKASSPAPTPISWDCLECGVEKRSEAALGLSGNEDGLVTVVCIEKVTGQGRRLRTPLAFQLGNSHN